MDISYPKTSHNPISPALLCRVSQAISSMNSTIPAILTSPLLLPTTSLISLTTALLIKQHVRSHGPIHTFRSIIKYNSIFYSLFSLILSIAITSSYFHSRSARIAKYGFTLSDLVCVQGVVVRDERLSFGCWRCG
ncbi:hypothetical protein BKA64DRAFT_662798 [Cadophora sp. MPI-SDFR-AT-0126]|nr:hypothetical protein BKA64DRAFT_662798 [Leotiomycetes sp. MPI-SDFR-AT-0126]